MYQIMLGNRIIGRIDNYTLTRRLCLISSYGAE